MKHGLRWAVVMAVLLALLAIAAGGWRTWSARESRQAALAASETAKNLGLAELAPSDVVLVQNRDILRGLALSGSLKAVHSAMIKARVPGELQGLTVREGDFVKAGQVIARIDATEYQSRVRQSRSQAESARAQVDVAQRQYDNNKALVDKGFISRTALDTSLANLNAAQASYRAAVAATDVLSQSVADTVLRSPIAGQVSQRLAQPGERVGLDARIVEVVDLRQLELEAALGAAEAFDVRVGQRAELQIEGSDRTVVARVARINPSAQAGSRSVLVYLALEPPAADSGALPLRQGLFARGTLGTARVMLLSVPLSAVRTDRPAPYVQAIENGQVVHRPVELGVRGTAGEEAVVEVKGLAEGAVLLRGNLGVLREGTPVRFTAALVTGGPGAGASAARPAP